MIFPSNSYASRNQFQGGSSALDSVKGKAAKIPLNAFLELILPQVLSGFFSLCSGRCSQFASSFAFELQYNLGYSYLLTLLLKS